MERLIKCQQCGRQFTEAEINKHDEICKKMFQKMQNRKQEEDNLPPLKLQQTESQEVSELGGISREKAREYLKKAHGDLVKAKQLIIQSMFHESETFDQKGNIIQKILVKNSKEEACLVCFVDKKPQEAVKLQSCGHGYFCIECLKAHAFAKMMEGKNNVGCLQCNKEILQKELKEILGDETFTKLDQRALNQLISVDPSLHHCPTPDCTYIVSWRGPEDGPPLCNCPICLKQCCLACGSRPFHKGMNCGEFQKQKEEQMKIKEQLKKEKSPKFPQAEKDNPDEVSPEMAEKLFQAYIKKSNIRICKRCGCGVVKESGCNKMKCRCGFRFCYVCLSENAQCGHTPSNHGFIDNITGGGDFSNLRDKISPT